jgi:hypothetical protein
MLTATLDAKITEEEKATLDVISIPNEVSKD